MTRETINYARLGVEACQTFTEGPVAFADFVRTILSVAAPPHVLQTTTAGKLLEPGQIVHTSIPDETTDRTQYAACAS
jgi:hypothetical protein